MKIKFLNKRLLDKVNRRAIANNYNRAVVQEFIDDLPDDMNFPVTLQLVHEHAAGKPVEPHMRCRIMTGQSLTGPFTSVFVDIEMGMFEMLPEADIPDPPNADSSKPSIPEFSSN
jgi:hypothetical protein